MFLMQPLPKSQQSIHKGPQKDENFTKTSMTVTMRLLPKIGKMSYVLQNLCN